MSQELGHARLAGKYTIAVYEKGIPVQGADGGFEHVVLDLAARLDAFLKLSETFGIWRSRIGRLLKLQLVPANVAVALGARADRISCECRFNVEGNDTPWQPARVRREVGGVFVYLRVPEDADMVQIRTGSPAYESPCTPLFLPVQLDRRD